MRDERGKRKARVGKVVSDIADKTIVVGVERTFRHPVYGRVIRRTKKLMAHDEQNVAHTGDFVRIMETRPLSRKKRWRLVEILRQAG